MLKKRIIPCLDIKNGRTVKGCNFVNLRDAGDPVELAERYSSEGADELVFLDISATQEERSTFLPLVEKIAQHINIPFSVGGGISTCEHIQSLLNAGADKVSLNSSIVKNPDLINQASAQFGSQAIIAAIDAKLTSNGYKVFTHGGTKEVEGLDLVLWAQECEQRGAGEILLTSMDGDGSKDGFDIPMLKIVGDAVNIPVIASGGAGSTQHFQDVFQQTSATAALAASVFHFQEIPIEDLKNNLAEKEIPMRTVN